jgi:all-trans-8'-apo-beta-carotenal 15,15'-oxygenase
MTAHPWSSGFRSLEEEHSYRVADVDGEVPRALRGTLFRNGSGRNQLAGLWFPHWFDGDGMITAMRFDEAGVHFRNRYVDTPNYRDETKAARILNRGFGKMRPGSMLANALRQPANVSNTSVVLESGRLLSLWEGGPPYELDPATLETRGVADFGGMLKAFSAHPKIDPDSGELFNFGIDYGPKTTLTPYRIANGAATGLLPVALPYPLMNHDFALTKNHLVFCLGPILVRSLKMILGFSSFDGALHWEGGKPTLILLVPRDGRAAPRFIETGAFFQFHFANGYEEDGAVILDLVRYPDYTVIGQALRDYWRSDWPAKGMAALTRLRVDLGSGKVDSRALGSGSANELPTINPSFVGKRHRYAYIACNPADRAQGLQQQIARVDVEGGAVTTHDFGANGYVGEPLFVPTGSAEDEGVVITLVFDAAEQRSAIVGLDARDLATKPLFTARLKHHVPYPLHGHFSRAH